MAGDVSDAAGRHLDNGVERFRVAALAWWVEDHHIGSFRDLRQHLFYLPPVVLDVWRTGDVHHRVPDRSSGLFDRHNMAHERREDYRKCADARISIDERFIIAKIEPV